MCKLVRITKDKRSNIIEKEEIFDAELVDYKGIQAYKFKECKGSPFGYFPLERLNKEFDICKYKSCVTVLK